MNSLLSGIFANPRDREDLLIAAVVIGLFGFFILNYALVPEEEAETPIAYVDEEGLNTHLVKIEEGETRPEPRRIIIDEDIEETRSVVAPLPVPSKVEKVASQDVGTLNIAADVDAPEPIAVEEVVAETVVEPTYEEETPDDEVMEESNAESDIYEAEEITEAEAEIEPEPIEPEPEAIEEAEVVAEEGVVEEFEARGGAFDCLIIVGAFKVAENADVLIDQLKGAGYGSKKVDNRGFTCVGIPVDCADKGYIATTKTSLKEKLKVDPWVMKN